MTIPSKSWFGSVHGVLARGEGVSYLISLHRKILTERYETVTETNHQPNVSIITGNVKKLNAERCFGRWIFGILLKRVLNQFESRHRPLPLPFSH